ncbi:MAG: hypothetical protein SGI71_13020 [Verrucomicrobiota bacterium]|nr:hypothetical protein [Verrucomicrobiota bacterium]
MKLQLVGFLAVLVLVGCSDPEPTVEPQKITINPQALQPQETPAPVEATPAPSTLSSTNSQGFTNNGTLSGDDVLTSTIRAGEVTKAKIESLVFTKAIESFKEQEGRLPASLDELVSTGYLKSLPRAPVGQKYEYNPETGEFTITNE